MTAWTIQLVVAGQKAVISAFQLDEDLVKLLKLLGIAFRLDGDVVVGNRGQHFNVIAQTSVELQVETGVENEILVIAERKTTGKTAAVAKPLIREERAARIGVGRIVKADVIGIGGRTDPAAVAEAVWVCLGKG